VAEDLVGLGPPVRLSAIFCSWFLSFSSRACPPSKPRTRLDDLFDVKLENITPAETRLGPFVLS